VARSLRNRFVSEVAATRRRGWYQQLVAVIASGDRVARAPRGPTRGRARTRLTPHSPRTRTAFGASSMFPFRHVVGAPRTREYLLSLIVRRTDQQKIFQALEETQQKESEPLVTGSGSGTD
jgi:hypothetical protein